MATCIMLGNIAVEVVLKDIKNIHLSVYPPEGAVRIAAPRRTKVDTLRVFAISKLAWIKQQQKKLREQARQTPREHVDRETHYVWGKRYQLALREVEAAPAVTLKHTRMVLQVRPGATAETRQEVVAHWYREQIRTALPALLATWEARIGVRAGHIFVQKMKTKWGSCNPSNGNIRFNTDLAKKPRQCLEYIVVHELIHLLEPHHNERFARLMDQHLPDWRQRRVVLNGAPLGHEDWGY
jgi:predicted metal-dependent hydrolase